MISIKEYLQSFMFTLAMNGYTQVNIKILLIQSYHTTCVSFSCEFSYKAVHNQGILHAKIET